MSTLLYAIETEVSNLSTRTRFEYAGDLEDANATIFDQIASGEFPVCLILAFDVNDTRANGIVKSKAEINALFLTKLDQITVDKKASEIDLEAIAPMRSIAREFINRLDENDIVTEAGIETVVHRSVHQALMDAHLYGCWSVFTVNFEEGISLCPPH
jgi:hypothetical protein